MSFFVAVCVMSYLWSDSMSVFVTVSCHICGVIDSMSVFVTVCVMSYLWSDGISVFVTVLNFTVIYSWLFPHCFIMG